MNTRFPPILYPDSSSMDHHLVFEGKDQPSYLLNENRDHLRNHWNMLSSVTPSMRDVEPLLFIKTRPQARSTAGSSFGRANEAFRLKYEKLAHQLHALRSDDSSDELIEAGAVETAANVIEQLSRREMAPPELSWIGSEAIIMLWILGETKYALTVTDGEVGYVVRVKGKTLRTNHSIPIDALDILKIK
jgi:hypothetical protein